jgi:hypothetical protein
MVQRPPPASCVDEGTRECICIASIANTKVVETMTVPVDWCTNDSAWSPGGVDDAIPTVAKQRDDMQVNDCRSTIAVVDTREMLEKWMETERLEMLKTKRNGFICTTEETIAVLDTGETMSLVLTDGSTPPKVTEKLPIARIGGLNSTIKQRVQVQGMTLSTWAAMEPLIVTVTRLSFVIATFLTIALTDPMYPGSIAVTSLRDADGRFEDETDATRAENTVFPDCDTVATKNPARFRGMETFMKAQYEFSKSADGDARASTLDACTATPSTERDTDRAVARFKSPLKQYVAEMAPGTDESNVLGIICPENRPAKIETGIDADATSTELWREIPPRTGTSTWRLKRLSPTRAKDLTVHETESTLTTGGAISTDGDAKRTSTSCTVHDRIDVGAIDTIAAAEESRTVKLKVKTLVPTDKITDAVPFDTPVGTYARTLMMSSDCDSTIDKAAIPSNSTYTDPGSDFRAMNLTAEPTAPRLGNMPRSFNALGGLIGIRDGEFTVQSPLKQ